MIILVFIYKDFLSLISINFIKWRFGSWILICLFCFEGVFVVWSILFLIVFMMFICLFGVIGWLGGNFWMLGRILCLFKV